MSLSQIYLVLVVIGHRSYIDISSTYVSMCQGVRYPPPGFSDGGGGGGGGGVVVVTSAPPPAVYLHIHVVHDIGLFCSDSSGFSSGGRNS